MSRLISLVLLAAVAAGCGPAANVAQERETLMRLDREWSGTVKDTNTFLSYFAADATMYAPGMPAASGTAAIRTMFTQMMAMPGISLTWAATRAEVAASGDVGYTVGTYQTSVGGAKEKGKYVTVWAKQADGQWKVKEDIFNADANPVGPHVMMPPASIKWMDAPPSLPPGAKIAVISGDPSQPGPFVIRAQMPAGYKIAPHWHPGEENVTALIGTVAVGMGEKWDDAKLETLGPGGYASLPAESRHYFMTKTAATIQVHGMGPFAVNYVNPADDPSKKK